MHKLLIIFLKHGKRPPGHSSRELIKRRIPKCGYNSWFQKLLDAGAGHLIDSGLMIDVGNYYELTNEGVNDIRKLVS